MSSPIDVSEDVDPALRYAPRWIRERTTAERSLTPINVPHARARKVARTRIRPEFSGDRAMLDLQRRLALNPDLIPEPSSEDGSVVWPILARLCAVTGLAAALAWGLVSLPAWKKAPQMARPEASTSSAALPAAPKSTNQVKLALVEPPPAPAQPTETTASAPPAPHVVAAAPANPEPAQPAVANDPPQAPAPQQAAPAPQQAAPLQVTPQQQDEHAALRLDDAEIAILIERGKDFLKNGDFASARLLLRRAADGGSADAAMALATTFDPVVLARLGAIGAAPDIAKAREWYQRAVDLGSTAASQQLAKLAAE
jgi:TPR repeat protein